MDVPPQALATTCRFCDGPLVDVVDGPAPVDRVLPFVLGERRASELLSTWLERRYFAPVQLRRAAAPDALRAILVPFYAFEAVTRANWSAQVGIEWQRIETYTTVENGKTVTKTRTVTEVEWFPTSGTHGASWDGHLVSASRGLPEAEANALEPFDVGHALPFAPERVAGLFAEHPTVPPDEARAVAVRELEARARAAVQRLLPGDRSRSVSASVDVALAGVTLVLVPVWVAVYGRGDGAVRLLVNGQTGEVVGSTPVDPARVAGAVVAGLLVLALIALLSTLVGS